MMASVMCLYSSMHEKKFMSISLAVVIFVYFSMYIYILDNILKHTNAKCHFMYTYSQLVDCCVT
jgi:hypothetical protein